MQFLNLMKSARPWIGHRPKQWGGMKTEELRAGGYLDEAGWVRAIPDGLEKVGTVFNWVPDKQMKAYRVGRYVVRYDGEGEVNFSGDARVIQRMPGHIVFENREARNWRLEIAKTDPKGNGNYVRNITVVSEKHVDLFDAGAVFNPDWLALIHDARELRFMDWNETNGSDIRQWHERARPDGPYTGRGHAIEDMVRLANEIGADAWFTIPHQADSDYTRKFAEYVRDHLDRRLTARVEWSNETWNWRFDQTRWSRDRSKAEWGIEAHRDYSAKKAVETALIWRDVFSGSDAGRLETILATHPSNAWYSSKLLQATDWKEHEPEAWIDPKTAFDVLATTSYFGGGLLNQADERAEFLRVLRTQSSDIDAYLESRIRTPDVKGSLARTVRFLRKQKEVAEKHGLRLVLYEGGQHAHSFLRQKPNGQAGETPPEVLETMHEVMINFVRSTEMARLYSDLWDEWTEIGQGPFMQFSDVRRPGKNGSWGLYRDLTDQSMRSRTLTQLSQKTLVWWGAKGGPHYQHGIVARGGPGKDSLEGTAEEDYLLAGAGDDTLFASPGRDGLHGGAGHDIVIFSQPRSSYILTEEGANIRVSSDAGSSLLVSVETVKFANGPAMKLRDLLQ